MDLIRPVKGNVKSEVHWVVWKKIPLSILNNVIVRHLNITLKSFFTNLVHCFSETEDTVDVQQLSKKEKRKLKKKVPPHSTY